MCLGGNVVAVQQQDQRKILIRVRQFRIQLNGLLEQNLRLLKLLCPDTFIPLMVELDCLCLGDVWSSGRWVPRETGLH